MANFDSIIDKLLNNYFDVDKENPLMVRLFKLRVEAELDEDELLNERFKDNMFKIFDTRLNSFIDLVQTMRTDLKDFNHVALSNNRRIKRIE